MRHDLSEHKPFLKVLAIKLVIFLSFWQSFGISALTGPTFNVIKATPTLAYPDISVGIPSLLVCIEMACFAVSVFSFRRMIYPRLTVFRLHIFAYPFSPYVTGEKRGGFLGIGAFIDAMNPWDLVKAFGRGMRWLFVGVKNREADPSYKSHQNDMVLETNTNTSYDGARGTEGLPPTGQFRQAEFGLAPTVSGPGGEEAGLIEHAQPNPLMTSPSRGESPRRMQYTPARLRYDPVTGQEVSADGNLYDPSTPVDIGIATPYGQEQVSDRFVPSETNAAHSMLWGQRSPQPAQYSSQNRSHNYQEPRRNDR